MTRNKGIQTTTAAGLTWRYDVGITIHGGFLPSYSCLLERGRLVRSGACSAHLQCTSSRILMQEEDGQHVDSPAPRAARPRLRHYVVSHAAIPWPRLDSFHWTATAADRDRQDDSAQGTKRARAGAGKSWVLVPTAGEEKAWLQTRESKTIHVRGWRPQPATADMPDRSRSISGESVFPSRRLLGRGAEGMSSSGTFPGRSARLQLEVWRGDGMVDTWGREKANIKHGVSRQSKVYAALSPMYLETARSLDNGFCPTTTESSGEETQDHSRGDWFDVSVLQNAAKRDPSAGIGDNGGRSARGTTKSPQLVDRLTNALDRGRPR
ncbi:hypothetical protein IWZ00DRAFT_575604 [Phyllosticta capitalensis]